MAIDGPGLCLDEQTLTIRTHDIVVDAAQPGTLGRRHVEEDTDFLARLE